MLRKITALKIVNVMLLVSFILQAGSGIFHSKIPHEVYEWIHEWNGAFLIILVINHLVLNWSWMKTNFLK